MHAESRRGSCAHASEIVESNGECGVCESECQSAVAQMKCGTASSYACEYRSAIRFYMAQLTQRPEVETAIKGEESLPSDNDLDSVVAQIQQVCRNSSLEFALHVGAIIIHNFYGGEVKAWRLRGPKTHSFRQLANHPDLPLSPAALYRCVAVFELCDRLNAAARFRRLGASHFRTVLGFDGAVQDQLLELANKKRWTVKTLHEEVLKLRSNQRVSLGGRRPQSALTKSLNVLRRGLLACQDSISKSMCGLEESEFGESVRLLLEARDLAEHLCQEIVQLKSEAASNDGAGPTTNEQEPEVKRIVMRQTYGAKAVGSGREPERPVPALSRAGSRR
jgi:hypothetical protein